MTLWLGTTRVSRPRGKAIQRRLFAQAKEFFRPWGATCEIDFSKRGGHQQLLVTLPNGKVHQIELPSSPRNEGASEDYLRQRCQRIVRDSLM